MAQLLFILEPYSFLFKFLFIASSDISAMVVKVQSKLHLIGSLGAIAKTQNVKWTVCYSYTTW